MKNLKKSHNHDHFWIEDGQLFESYNTIRGLRYRFIALVNYPDTGNLSEDDIEQVNKNFK